MKTPEKLTWAACGLTTTAIVAAVVLGVWTLDSRWYSTAWVLGGLAFVLFIAGAAQAGARAKPSSPILPPIPTDNFMRWETTTTRKPKEDA